MGQVHVIFGGAGGLGAAIAKRLLANGVSVRAIVRDVLRATNVLSPEVEIFAGDALTRESTTAASKDAAVIYHCVNVPYQDWADQMPRVTINILAAAREVKARLVFPGNVYGYGPLQSVPAKEDHPLAATGEKGQLRNGLENLMLAAHRAGEVAVVIPRFPDWYGPNVTSRPVGPIFVAALEGKRANWIGDLETPHDLVFIEDAAAACILLGETESAYGQTWHVPGPGPLTGRQFIEMVFQAAGTEPNIGIMGGDMLRFLSLFSRDHRDMLELLYEFEEPLVLDGSKFAGAFPDFQYTLHQEAIRKTLAWFQRRRRR